MRFFIKVVVENYTVLQTETIDAISSFYSVRTTHTHTHVQREREREVYFFVFFGLKARTLSCLFSPDKNNNGRSFVRRRCAENGRATSSVTN